MCKDTYNHFKSIFSKTNVDSFSWHHVSDDHGNFDIILNTKDPPDVLNFLSSNKEFLYNFFGNSATITVDKNGITIKDNLNLDLI